MLWEDKFIEVYVVICHRVGWERHPERCVEMMLCMGEMDSRDTANASDSSERTDIALICFCFGLELTLCVN